VATEGVLRWGWRWTPDPNTLSPEDLDNAIMVLSDMGIMDSFGGGNAFTQARGGTTPADRPGVTVTNRVVKDLFQGGNLASYGQTLQPGKGVLSADVNLALLIQLLIKNRNASVVAHPQITVNNNQKGHVFVGDSVPFETGRVTTTAGGPGAQTTVEYRDVGTLLEITPQINKQGRTVLRIYIQSSRLKPELVAGRIATELQNYETQITVENGQTAWLGGLTDRRVDDVVRKLPLLGDIPYAGPWLFSKTDKQTLVSNIYTFITPTVIETPEQADVQTARARKEIDTYMKQYEGLDLKLPGVTDTLTSAALLGPIIPPSKEKIIMPSSKK
jgi:type II secretory pathway component GspD/PulD (secretin)